MGPQPEKAVEADILANVKRRYRDSGRFAKYYVSGKLRHDPVLPVLLRLAQAAPMGHLVDVGCGRGQFSAALLQAGLADSAIGLDWQEALLSQAQRAMRDLPFQICRQDFSADPRVPTGDTVLLIDILYQLPAAAQRALLLGAASACRKRLLIRTADPTRGLRSLVTRWVENAGRAFWPNSGAHVNPPRIEDITLTLKSCGFACSVAPCWSGTPFSNVLILSKKIE